MKISVKVSGILSIVRYDADDRILGVESSAYDVDIPETDLHTDIRLEVSITVDQLMADVAWEHENIEYEDRDGEAAWVKVLNDDGAAYRAHKAGLDVADMVAAG